jgi:hypothetical protein
MNADQTTFVVDGLKPILQAAILFARGARSGLVVAQLPLFCW